MLERPQKTCEMVRSLMSQQQNSTVSKAGKTPVTEVEFAESALGFETGALEKRIVDAEDELALKWVISRPHWCWSQGEAESVGSLSILKLATHAEGSLGMLKSLACLNSSAIDEVDLLEEFGNPDREEFW